MLHAVEKTEVDFKCMWNAHCLSVGTSVTLVLNSGVPSSFSVH